MTRMSFAFSSKDDKEALDCVLDGIPVMKKKKKRAQPAVTLFVDLFPSSRGKKLCRKRAVDSKELPSYTSRAFVLSDG